MRNTLAQSLDAVFRNTPGQCEAEPDVAEPPVEPPPDEPPPPPDTPAVPGSVADLNRRVLQAFADAEAALMAGDLATFQEKIDEAQELSTQIDRLLAETDGTSGG